MKIVPIVLLIFQAVKCNACCAEGSTIIQIKNYDGPIYLHAPHQCDDKTLYHLTPKTECNCDCDCVSKPASTCVPINTACQCTAGLYLPQTLYQDTCVTPQCTPGYSYNSCPMYQDQYYPVVPVTQCGRQDCSYLYGTCGRTYSY